MDPATYLRPSVDASAITSRNTAVAFSSNSVTDPSPGTLSRGASSFASSVNAAFPSEWTFAAGNLFSSTKTYFFLGGRGVPASHLSFLLDVMC